MWSRRISVTQALEVVRGGDFNLIMNLIFVLTWLFSQRATRSGSPEGFMNNSFFLKFVDTLLLPLRASMSIGVLRSIDI